MVSANWRQPPVWVNLREGSAGIEFIAALTVILLALPSALDSSTSSIIVLLLGLKFPGLWLNLVLALGVVHFVALCFWSRRLVITIRKLCCIPEIVIFIGFIRDVKTIGVFVWFGLIALFLAIAICRFDYNKA